MSLVTIQTYSGGDYKRATLKLISRGLTFRRHCRVWTPDVMSEMSPVIRRQFVIEITHCCTQFIFFEKKFPSFTVLWIPIVLFVLFWPTFFLFMCVIYVFLCMLHGTGLKRIIQNLKSHRTTEIRQNITSKLHSRNSLSHAAKMYSIKVQSTALATAGHTFAILTAKRYFT